MATQYTPKLGLNFWQLGDRNWHLPYQETCELLDGLAIGSLAVRPVELPSTSLNVRISAGSYRKADGTIGTYAGTASQAIPASATTRLWLADAGTLASGADWPVGVNHVRLATVTTDATTVTEVLDARIPWASFGATP